MSKDFHAYSDESYQDGHRFRSISIVSVSADEAQERRGSLRALLNSHQIEELKWEKIRGANYRSAAIRTIEWATSLASRGSLRVDTLTWDTHDSRHSVTARNDNENFARMYYHLGGTAFGRQPRQCRWTIFPDEKSGVDWETIRDCLHSRGNKKLNSIQGQLLRLAESPAFSLADVIPQKSHESELCQLADLFAGLAGFSHNEYETYSTWLACKNDELGLFDSSSARLSSGKQEKVNVLHSFKSCCDDLKLGVSLTSSKRLQTLDPTRPLNFWTYEPQGQYDKAPRNT